MHTDFNLKANMLTITRQYQQRKGGGQQFDDPKTQSGNRTVPLPKIVAQYLRSLPAPTSLYLMANASDGSKPMHPTSIYHETQAVITAAKLPKMRFHDLRHSANNVLKQLGVDAVTRRDILGHSTTAVTENIYTQTVDAEELMKAREGIQD